MKNYLILIFTIFLFVSCRKPEDPLVNGCKDSTALNFNPEAIDDDCTCEYDIYDLELLNCFTASFGVNYNEYYINNQNSLPLLSNDISFCNEYLVIENDTLHINFIEESVCIEAITNNKLPHENETTCEDSCGYWIDVRCPLSIYYRSDSPDSIFTDLDGNWRLKESRNYNNEYCYQVDYGIMEIDSNSTVSLKFQNNTVTLETVTNGDTVNFSGMLNTSDSDTSITVNNHKFFQTEDKCMDVDISDSDSMTVIAVAANYAGYYIFEVVENEEGYIEDLYETYHGTDMDPNVGDNRAERVIISNNYRIVFILDKYDKIWMYKLDDRTQYSDNWVEDCYGGAWISTTIDDKDVGIRIFSLVNHSSAQSEPSGTVGDYDQYSTSLVWKYLTDVGPEDVFTDSGVPACEYTYNLSTSPTEIYYSNEKLSVANGEMGVLVFKQINQNICVDNNGEEIPEFVPSEDDEEDREYCTNPPSDGPWIPGLGGNFEPVGGMLPTIFSSFDTPGSVNSLYSAGNYIFAGLSTSNGCYMVEINDVGDVIYTLPFAQGYTINGVHKSGGLVGLAAGHAGVLLYEWDGIDIMYLGNLQTSYANKIKVQGNRVFVATEDGIDIFEIER